MRTSELATEFFVRASRFTRGVTSMVGSSEQPNVVWRVLASLQVRGPLRASQLSALESVSQPSISMTLQRLERLGYVSRHPDPTDNRATLFEIEEAGAELIAAHRARIAEFMAPYLDSLSELDRAAIVRVNEIMDEIAAGERVAHRRIS